MAELKGRVALVTGAGRNIGRAIALELAAAGASVVVNARASRAEAEAVAAEIGPDALVAMADVTDRPSVDAMVDATMRRFGRLDILVNNAAVRGEKAFEELDYETWRKVLAICLDGAFNCSQAALAALKASGSGTIVNIGGLTAHTGAADRAHVVTAKSGLVGLTRALAHDLAEFGITVNNVSPGMMDTARGASAGHQQPRHHSTHKPLIGRRGRPDEIAGAVRWLVGPAGRFVTGQVIHVNGGTYLGG
ncbi:MAG: SDR family oxidoreductase [Alphaproteobacteria bacterium]|nr:SDR family oxidoreductase [Alphaproteobacteria bacterium]